MPGDLQPNPEALLRGATAWIRQETPTGDVDAVGRLVALVERQSQEAGLVTDRFVCVGHADGLRVRAPWRRGRPGILILAHLDTVHAVGSLVEQPIRVDGDRLYGPGSYDMKGGAFIALQALQTLVGAGAATALPVTILFVPDEETGSLSSRTVTETEARQHKYALVVEPCRDGGAVVTQRSGSARFKLRFNGKAAHAGIDHAAGRSAIAEMARQILRVEAMTESTRRLTLNVGTARGGTRANIVPDRAEIEVDARFPDQATGEAIVNYLQRLRPDDPDVELAVDGGISRPAFQRTEDVARLYEIARAAAADVGFDLPETATGGASDANLTAPIIPTLDGLGVDGGGAHTMTEHLLISSLAPRCALLIKLMQRLV